ncbi:MAG TPA: DUF3995 domain-containing protein [Acidobacteriaceae bacterium]|nr:DUF3995 domain-containing protein [Acidobacteriaceae bacterium]
MAKDSGVDVAYGAAVWAFAFAAMSFYWAAAMSFHWNFGLASAATIGNSIVALVRAHDHRLLVILWVTGALKLAAGMLALAFVRPWGERLIPHWALLSAGWCVGVLTILYGTANLAEHALMVRGIVATPAGLGLAAARWHLWLWDPWWLTGGILFLATTLFYERESTDRRAAR